MGQSPSGCVSAVSFPYPDVNFWQGDQSAFFYPIVAGDFDCINGSGQPYTFSVALIGPGGMNYACDDIRFGVNTNTQTNITCPSVSRDSLSAGDYFFRFTTQSDGSVNDGTTFSISRNDAINSCADSITFPDMQSNFNFASDDTTEAFTTFGYDAYQCYAYEALIESTLQAQTYNFQSTLVGPTGTSYYSPQKQFPGTSRDANPYGSPLTIKATYYGQVIRGTMANGEWTTLGILYQIDVNTGGIIEREPQYTFTVSHDASQSPVPTYKGFKKRQNPDRCPAGHEQCLIPGTRITECLDIMNDLESCGGCPGTNASVDCATLSRVDTVACIRGVCVLGASTEDWGLVVQ